MPKVLSERDIVLAHRAKKLNKKDLKPVEKPLPPEPKKPEPRPELEAMNKTLEQILEIYKDSKNQLEMTNKIISLLADRMSVVDTKGEREPSDWEFDIYRDDKGFIARVTARAVS